MEMKMNYEPIYQMRLIVDSMIHVNGMRKTELSRRTGISISTIQKYCSPGCTTININDLAKIAKALKIRRITGLVDLYSFDPANTLETIIGSVGIRYDWIEKFVMECLKGYREYNVWTEKEAITYAAEGLLEIMRKRKADRKKIEGIAEFNLNIKNLSKYLDMSEEEKQEEYAKVTKQSRRSCFYCKYCNEDSECTNLLSEKFESLVDVIDDCDEWHNNEEVF